MKKYICFLLFFGSIYVIASCSKTKEETVVEPAKVAEDITPLLENYPMRVTDAYRIIGNDSLNLLSDTIYQQYRDAVFLTFRENGVYFYSGNRITNTKFPPNAQTFSLNIKIMLPTNMDYHWDQEQGKVIVTTSGLSSYFPIIPDGKKAYLDTTGTRLYKTFEEARDAVKPAQIRFIYDDVDPKLGAVKYAVTLRPLWFYERVPEQLSDYRYVMF